MTNKKPAKKKSQTEQSETFIEKAREIGADTTSAADMLMRRLASMKPEPRTAKPTSAKAPTSSRKKGAGAS